MSERFVKGWSVSLPALRAKKLTAKAVLASKANAKAKTDVFMTFGQGYEKEDIAEGKVMATETLESLFSGKLDKDLEYEYARVLELVLNHVATPFAKTPAQEIYLGHTYHTQYDDAACWNPFLELLGMKQLAKAWGDENLKWPWPKQTLTADWPIWWEFPPALLPKLAAELAPITRKSLDAIPDAKMTDQLEYANETRDELFAGLKRLREWIGKTKKGESLVLVMDGDQ